MVAGIVPDWSNIEHHPVTEYRPDNSRPYLHITYAGYESAQADFAKVGAISIALDYNGSCLPSLPFFMFVYFVPFVVYFSCHS